MDGRWFGLLEQTYSPVAHAPSSQVSGIFDRAIYPEIFRMILDHGRQSPIWLGRFRVSPSPITWRHAVLCGER